MSFRWKIECRKAADRKTGQPGDCRWMRLGRSMTLCLLAPGLLLLGGARACSGQFSGPALKLPDEPNQVQTPTLAPDLLAPRTPDFRIAAGDVLSVRIFGSQDYAPVVKVGTDGSTQLPLIGSVMVGGLSVAGAEDAVARGLVSAGMYRHPSVSIQVTEFSGQFVTIEGEVKSMVVPVTGERRLLDILAAAGGLPPTASHVINILRPGVEKPIVIDLGTDPAKSARGNVAVLPRDTIIVSKVGVVYVIGAFVKQGAIPLDQSTPLTLMQASSLTGGIGFEGKFDELKIIRTEGTGRTFVKVDIKRVLRGEDPDPILKADDIIFLPTNQLKAALKNGGIATIVALTQVAILAVR